MQISTIGIDIAKNVFQVHGVDAAGGTDVVERTTHELRLEPVLYWLPLARWIVNENNARD